MIRVGHATAGLAVALLAGCAGSPSALRPGEESCLIDACHGRVEAIHYGGDPLACIDCHGGDPEATTKETAHPTVTVSFNPATPGVSSPEGRLLRGASLQELDELDPDILMFLNPADYRVVDRTCGSTTRGGGNCHTRIAQNSVLSTHATLSGQLAGGLYFGGLTDKSARWAVRATTDPFPIDAPGYAASLDRLPDDIGAMPGGGPVERAFFAAYGQLCVECHLAKDGPPTPGKYTSSGCNACHILTHDDGRPYTTDPTQDFEELGHGAVHRLTNLIPDSQCNRCHHAHLHRGLLAQGVRERSEPEGDTGMGGVNTGVEDPEHAVYWSEDNYVRYQGGHYLYDKPFPFYVVDEDGTNDVDETPPDVHTEKGMGCIDCHTMPEVHGGDHMAVRREFEARVRCESCHGAPQKEIPAFGLPFQVAISRVGGSADNPAAIERAADGSFVQVGKLDGLDHPVTQIARRVDPADPTFNPRTQMGCLLHAGSAEVRAELALRYAATPADEVDELFPGMPEGAALAPDVGDRAGRMECFACHNAWTVNCFGCHMVRDDREMGVNQVTGARTPGRVSTHAMSVVPDALALGFNSRGLISPMVGTSIFVTHIDAAGNRVVDAAPLRTVDGFEGDGSQHNPVHHHTVRKLPRDCDGCHPRADGVPNAPGQLERATGFGTGEFLFLDGQGEPHVLDRLVAFDFDGDGVPEDPLVSPLGNEVYEAFPIAANTHLPLTAEAAALGPGPLDATTANRMLQNPVVPQRAAP